MLLEVLSFFLCLFCSFKHFQVELRESLLLRTKSARRFLILVSTLRCGLDQEHVASGLRPRSLGQIILFSDDVRVILTEDLLKLWNHIQG